MAENRIEILKNLVAQNPGDSFARYGLAMACASAGDYAQAVENYR
jgi:cytochrome c-type biogenesis protein CcmH/NrfG